jgi:hypothetical protein
VATIRIGCDLGRTTARAVAVELRERRHEPPEVRIVATAEAVRDGGDGERPLAAVVEELVDRLGRNARGTWTVVAADLPLVVKVIPVPGLDAARTRRLLRLEVDGMAGALSADGQAQGLAADTVALPAGDGDPLHLAMATDAAGATLLLAQLAKGGVHKPRLAVPPAMLANLALLKPDLAAKGPVLVVDIGREASAVALLGPAGLIGCRSIAIGGQAFTEALAGPGADAAALAAAERRKLAGEGHTPLASALAAGARPTPAPVPAAADDGLDLEGSPATGDDSAFDLPPSAGDLQLEDEPVPVPATTAVDDLLPAPPGITTQAVAVRVLGPELARAAEAFYLQVATTMTWVKAQTRQNALAPVRIVLTGGGARLLGLSAYLERRFAIPVSELDPADGLAGRPEGHAGAWGMALCAALADAEGAVAPDLTPAAILRQRAWTRELLWPYVAAACLVVAGALLAWDLAARAGAAREEVRLMKTFSGSANQRLHELEGLEAAHAAMQADLRAIAGRIYAGRDLLDVLQAAKRQAAEAGELWLTQLRTIAPDPAAAPAVGEPRDRFGAGSRPVARPDATVDRGGVELSGYVKFDSEKTYDEIVRYFDGYYTAIRSARGITGEILFTESEVRAIDIKRDTRVAANGKVPFTIRLWFRPTSLEPAGERVPETAP